MKLLTWLRGILLAALAQTATATPIMSWNLRRDFFVDITAEYGSFLITSATDSSLRNRAPDMVAGDGMPVRFHFFSRLANGLIEVADPGSGTTFVFSGRPAGAPSGSQLLFKTEDFTEISAGVWEGTLDLSTAEFQAHLDAAPAGTKTILGEIEVRDAGNTVRNSIQFDLSARPQVHLPDDESPTPLAGPIGSTAPVNGQNQVETVTVEVTSVIGGTVIFTITSAIVEGSPIEVDFTAGYLDSAVAIAASAVDYITLHSAITDKFLVDYYGGDIVLTAREAAVNDPTLNIAISLGTETGVVPVAESTATSAGVAPTLTPPYLRVADDWLYVQDAGVWKRLNLSDF